MIIINKFNSINICDSVLIFDRICRKNGSGEISERNPETLFGRIQIEPVSILKTVLFGFVENRYTFLEKIMC